MTYEELVQSLKPGETIETMHGQTMVLITENGGRSRLFFVTDNMGKVIEVGILQIKPTPGNYPVTNLYVDSNGHLIVEWDDGKGVPP